MKSSEKTYVAQLPKGSYRVVAKGGTGEAEFVPEPEHLSYTRVDGKIAYAPEDALAIAEVHAHQAMPAECFTVAAALRETFAAHGVTEPVGLLDELACNARDALIALGWRPTLIPRQTTAITDEKAWDMAFLRFCEQIDDCEADDKQAFDVSMHALVTLARHYFPTADSADLTKEPEHPVFVRGYWVEAIRDAENQVLWNRDAPDPKPGTFTYWLGQYSQALRHGADRIVDLIDEPGHADPDHPEFGPPTYRRALVFPRAS